MNIWVHLFKLAAKYGQFYCSYGAKIPEGLQETRDIPYGDHPDQVLDVYAPEGARDLPLLVNVHGGGWVYGTKDAYRPYCMHLAKQGFVVVNFTYRLAPLHRWPAQMEDTCAAFAWALEHAKEYGGDPERLVAVGDSAGGQILSLYCCCCTNPELAKLNGANPPEGGLPKAVGLNCGCYSARHKGVYALLTNDVLSPEDPFTALDNFLTILHVDETFPPAQLVSASKDFMLEDSLALAERLEQVGAPHEFVKRTAADGKPLYHVFNLVVRSKLAQRTNKEQCEFLLRHV